MEEVRHTYCSKLSVDSSAISKSDYESGMGVDASFEPVYGYPFAGYVNFTKYDVSVNPFDESQDYLQRWDTASGMVEAEDGSVMCTEDSGTCVKINDMYCSTSKKFEYRNEESFNGNGSRNKVFLSMVPLAKNINYDSSYSGSKYDTKGLSFFMDMANEIKTQQKIDIPYSTDSSVQVCNLDFCAAGFCKSNIPYIGLEYISRMINSDSYSMEENKFKLPKLYDSSAGRNDVFGSSEKSTLMNNGGSYIETYEFPGCGRLFLNPYDIYRSSDDSFGSNDNSVGSLTSTIYSDSNSTESLAYILCDKIANVISDILNVNKDSSITIRDEGNRWCVIEIDDGGITPSITDKQNNIIQSYLELLHRSGAIYKKISDNGEFEVPKNELNLHVGFKNYSTPEWDTSIGGSDNSLGICSLYDNSLGYYIDKGEKFNVGNKDYGKNDIANGKYFFVIRSIIDTLLPENTDLHTCEPTKSFLNKCNSTISAGALYNRMDLYPNTSGNMIFFTEESNDLNASKYTGIDSSTFKPRTSEYQTNLYTNYIPAFTGTPEWNDSSKSLSNMGVIEEDVEIQFDGSLYVSAVTLVFEGDTIKSLSESAKIAVGENLQYVKTDIKVNKQGNTEFIFEFDASKSPASILSSSGKATKNNMNVYSVGAQQMLKYCSFPGYELSENTTFDSIYRLEDYDTSSGTGIDPVDSQMTFTKITGRIPVYISGSGIYNNNSTSVKLISAYITLTDNTRLDVSVNSLGIAEASGDSSYGVLSWLGRNTLKFVSPVKVTLPYTIYNPFLGSMSGDIPRYTTDEGGRNHTMGVSSFTYGSYRNKLGLDYQKDNVVCVGPNYKKSDASCGTLKTFLKPNSAYATDLKFKQLTYDLGLQKPNESIGVTNRGTSVGGNSVYYSINKNAFVAKPNKSIADQLNPGSNSSYIDLLLPKPNLKVILVYDSVEFNGASAWTFVRSMPLKPGSADAPHILIYKVEAWVTKAGSDEVDSSATSTMRFNHEESIIFSGYVSSENSKSELIDDYHFCVKGINDAIINDTSILNNCYLKVDDGGNTEDLNAVGTAFPIRDITGNEDFYGAPGLNSKIYSNIESFGENVDINNDNVIYNELFSRAKTKLKDESSNTSSGAQIVVLSYCHPTLKNSSAESGDSHKVIYICVGFYNSREEMIPINGKFGITYTYSLTPNGEGAKDYTTYMYLSEFFPKDSMIYLAGKDYKRNIENEENNKFAFVTNDIKEKYETLSGDGINSGELDLSEIINIGPSNDETSYEIDSSSESIRHWEDVSIIDASITPGLTASHYAGHYGILNRYSGKVSFVSRVPYTDYKKYTDSLQGKCLLNHEHICYFSNKTGVVTLL